MRQERWRRVDELFEAALQMEARERERFLRAACAGDDRLRLEVEEMLRYDEKAAEFIETPVFQLAARLMTADEGPAARVAGGGGGEGRSAQFSSSSGSIDDARFVAGDVLAERYRVVGLLGRGGMGEVYRADDLKLKQPVALKFLAGRLDGDAAALARFYQEVSVARQVSHRHVCRVYDVGEAAGQHFLSMEYVRGEELSSLLKRIGRLPEDKAKEIARQLCAGLAAVHERGILHRDLKPANVMVDERGEVRITDFGIAALAGEVRAATAGTPAYMSPEQLEGRELTVRSDIYSLGLVLYELFTGRRAFEAASLPELMRLRRSDTTPTSPSELVAGLDPLIERVIFRCLDKDPERRPATALQVAAALPGGDPLAAALAAGETPSPEMVAAAPKEGALKPSVAVSLLAALLLLVGTICFFSKEVNLYQQVPLDKSPEVLSNRASEIVKRLGYTERPGDSAYGMGIDRGYLQHIRDNDRSPARWERVKTGQPAAIYFWQRQSPRPFDVYLTDGEVMEDLPEQTTPGMTRVTLDTLGRLRSFSAMPSQTDSTPGEVSEPDWSNLFAESGLDPSKFRPVPSTWVPPHAYTSRAAWEGVYPEQPEFKIHVEAAAHGARPVYFEIIDVWERPPDPQAYLGDKSERALAILLLSIFITAMVGGVLLAWRNLRLGRGDRRGAFRLAAFSFAVSFVQWLFTSHHVPTEYEALLFIEGVRGMLFWACFFWVVYLAFEPFVRRRWPGRIISWSRLMAGSFQDPLVGRDVLLGIVFGFGFILCNFYVANLVPRWLGYAPDVPWFDFPATQLLGIRSFVRGFTLQIFASMLQPFILLFFLFLLYIILRRDWLAAAALWAIVALALSLAGGNRGPAGVPFAFLSAFLFVWVMYRYGLLASAAAIFVLHLNIFFPMTSDFTAWYAGDFVPALVIVLALACYGFYTSLAGQSLFRGDILEG
ncbi:MAG TPA: serine/threonine-protein kinase [Pyrinomonadaceae bacterium]|nr:serine/threonine-protein kinase [Pyrinomonadaceae bacterium]